MYFIHYKEAWNMIFDAVPKSNSILQNLPECLGYYTAEDVFAPVDIPLFDNAAMDGFGFSDMALQAGKDYKIVGEIKAGSSMLPPCQTNEAIRIFTGAPVPSYIRYVVQKEHCEWDDNIVKLTDGNVTPGMNIRPKGSQSAKGSRVLPQGTRVTAGIIGFLAGFGIARLRVLPFPKIGVLITGDELVAPDETPAFGQIFESNSFAVQALLRESGIEPAFVKRVPDNLDLLTKETGTALEGCDLLILTGGISVGDYDFVQEALQQNGVQKQFYKIRQKPGKPIYFGRKEEKVIFALPGNPASVFTCFEVYVKPFIRACISGKKEYILLESGQISHDFAKKQGLTHFYKSRVENGKVKILSGQESYKMDSFVTGNCLAIIEEETEFIRENDNIQYIRIG